MTTNLGLLRWLVAHRLVREGGVATSFLDEHPPFSPDAAASPVAVGLAAERRAATATTAAGARPLAARSTDSGERSEIRAPMPGTVVRVLVSEGELVTERQPLVVLEAMKMETPIVSPYAAVVRRLAAREGDHVPPARCSPSSRSDGSLPLGRIGGKIRTRSAVL